MITKYGIGWGGVGECPDGTAKLQLDGAPRVSVHMIVTDGEGRAKGEVRMDGRVECDSPMVSYDGQ